MGGLKLESRMKIEDGGCCWDDGDDDDGEVSVVEFEVDALLEIGGPRVMVRIMRNVDGELANSCKAVRRELRRGRGVD